MRLSKEEKSALQQIGLEVLELRFDHERRFRNALRVIAKNDPRWMVWVDANLPKHIRAIDPKFLMLVEAHARAIVLKSYDYFHQHKISGLIFREDWPFSDSGNLTPG